MSVTSMDLHNNIGREIIKAMILLDVYKMSGTAHTCFPNNLIYVHSISELVYIRVPVLQMEFRGVKFFA